MILDGAHTPEAARFLVETLRSAVPAGSPVALVLAMAADKDIGCGLGVLHSVLECILRIRAGKLKLAVQSCTHSGVCAELGKLQPVATFPVEVDVAGARARSAAPGTIMANWQFNGRPDGSAGDNGLGCSLGNTIGCSVSVNIVFQNVTTLPSCAPTQCRGPAGS